MRKNNGKAMNQPDLKKRRAKEAFPDFYLCSRCLDFFHSKRSPHLTQRQLNEAINFPVYRLDGHLYFLTEITMIARANQIEEKKK